MDGDTNSAMTFWGLALGGKNSPMSARDPVERAFRITKAVLNEPLRLQTRDEYASLYLETDADVEVELLRFVVEDGVEKPLDVTFNAGDKVTFRVLGFPAPCVHLIGHYLDGVACLPREGACSLRGATCATSEGACPLREATCATSGHELTLQKLLSDWNNKMIIQLVEREMQRDTRDREDDERYTKLTEMITNVESNIRERVSVDHMKVAELMCEIMSEIRLVREGLGGLVEALQNDVKKMWKELNVADVTRRLDALQQEVKNTQIELGTCTRKLKEDLDFELDQMKKEIKKTIASSLDFEEDFEELKRLIRSMD